ncbi:MULTISPECIES: UDP-N-acetylmuramoyl-tripeptide--D-alanyl-D-alanine ligase [unclassified Enterococcus]|uniref:UDP-N-acetylmuramoyl-tripeptide--D-alanyl-D- alanine ligase n=1 Tax=unclassified Enterococcus TaxID=2608891 RepID=UPI001A9B3857|nr:UDP-N-acetylmuramoyl-tripeptide--D-alanyl-D-alanine ligase [Enterococcus sp. DIV1271a]MBO1298538.1 UDP-N-acetylmuramoyl-tripeptide--D-alanyl-D-alanine ligase [Enterococcus sp. DIV1271a]
MNITIQEAAQAVGSHHDSSQLITGVEFDSRKITEGNLFVPLAGARDGHEFIEQAIANGAVATFWSWEVEKAPEGIAIISVSDPLKAMQELAQYYLKKVGADVVAVTGSNGKTTTKDLTASVLAQGYKTYKTQGNYNNNIGMPYTILHMPQDTEKIVLEMGMDHANEITELSLLAQPKVAAITMIGEAHIENLGSREGIAQAKMEIADGLLPDGLLLVPNNEPLLEPLLAPLTQKIKTFGIEEGDISAQEITEEKQQTTFIVEGESFTIPLPGSYNVTNALIAYAIGQFFELSLPAIRRGLATVSVTQNRTEWLTAGNGAAILSDVYNANPTAMGLVLDTVANIPATGRKLAVLADMLELGAESSRMHASMSEHISSDVFSMIFLYGKEMQALKDVLAQKYPDLPVYHTEENKEQLIAEIVAEIQPDDTIVLKGSNSMGLIEVVERLQEMK